MAKGMNNTIKTARITTIVFKHFILTPPTWHEIVLIDPANHADADNRNIRQYFFTLTVTPHLEFDVIVLSIFKSKVPALNYTISRHRLKYKLKISSQYHSCRLA